MAQVIGIGGIFWKAENPAKLAKWYQTHLGLPVEDTWSGAIFKPQAMPADAYTVWSLFEMDTEYLNPGRQSFMINFVVDDIEGAMEQIKSGGGKPIDSIVEEPYGKFAWFMDPEDNKIELWEPAKASELLSD